MDLNILNNTPNLINDKRQGTFNEHDIAIIGMNAQIGQTENIKAFWEALCDGQDFIIDFPNNRYDDANAIYTLLNGDSLPENLIQCAYMKRIDLFDPSLFHISATEAEYMSPMQRIFLESAWLAIEDGGYGGEKIKNTATGIYLGYSTSENPFGEAVTMSDPEAGGIVVSGNVNSIIASRISYLLNLSGPALLIDTACSSSLVALHIACNQIQSGEVEMALAGGIRLMVLPRMQKHNLLGVESLSSHAKTFDASADGTGGGEGVVCLLLKRATEAERDGDHIYAIIKGSAINQDGASMGLTAPSADAQDTVIRTAWKNSKIDPSEISFIEAHGTGTKLGDPIEINGIEKAFRHYTNKNQFCAIGAVKTNIGHLDAAAGLVGVLKTVLMLNHKMIPPTTNFYVPNDEINFISSPVYVADKLTSWDSERSLRLCGVSSFGISGTNCHVILEESPKRNNPSNHKDGYYLLTISAETKELLEERIKEYKEWLLNNPESSFEDFCYTANYGRHVFNCRFYAFICSKQEFLNTDYDLAVSNENYAYNQFKAVNTKGSGNLLSQGEQLSRQVLELLSETVCAKNSIEYAKLLKNIGYLFVMGADIPWKTLCRGERRLTLQIPVHKLNHRRCWPRIIKTDKHNHESKKRLHPLIDELVEDSYHIRTYHTWFSTKSCWELREHKINDVHVLVGTAFIEMAHFIAKDYLKTKDFVLMNLVFYQALTSKQDEVTEVHSIVKQEDDVIRIGFYSKNKEHWKCHMELEVKKHVKERKKQENLDIIMNRSSIIDLNQMPSKSKEHIVQIESVRWSNIDCVWKGNDELLIKFNVNESLKEEKSKYFLYPSLLDPAINFGNILIDSVFLPYSCKSAEFYEKLPDVFYSHIRRKANQSSEEFSLFDITFYSEFGEVIGKLDDYVIKRVNELNMFFHNDNVKDRIFHKIEWKKQDSKESSKTSDRKQKTILLCREEQLSNELSDILEYDNVDVAVVGSAMEQKSCKVRYLRNCQEDYEAFVDKVDIPDFTKIVYTTMLGKDDFIEPDEAEMLINITLKSLFYLVKALLNARIRNHLELVLLTEHYDKVVQSDVLVNPFSRAFAGMGVCIQHEYDNFNVRIIDIDKQVDRSLIEDEIRYPSKQKIVALRKDGRYSEILSEYDYEPKSETNLRDSGVYVIAGGLGGMGLAFCKRLLSNNKQICVILLNRSYSEAELRNSTEENEIIGKKVAILKKLWDDGYNIHVEQCDISNYIALAELFKSIRANYGRIDGIIHAAGIAGDGFIINKTWEEFSRVLAPKVSGTLNLHLLTANDELQFFVMCSSMTSIFGAPGQSDYTAANAFMDGFASYKTLSGCNALAIDWTGWSESGMAANYGVDEEDKFVYFLNDEEGAEVMYYSLQLSIPRVLAGRFNYINLQKQIKKYEGLIMLTDEMISNQEEEISENDNVNEVEQIDISDLIITGKRIDMLTPVDIHIILAWVKTLQVKEVDINDKFFEVGGNSLLVAYLHKEIEKYYPGITSITDLFLYSSISEIANFIEGKQTIAITKEDDNVSQDIDDLLEKFMNGELNIDEVDEKIKL